jgi:thioredoxin-like negative regulator of GroEL
MRQASLGRSRSRVCESQRAAAGLSATMQFRALAVLAAIVGGVSCGGEKAPPVAKDPPSAPAQGDGGAARSPESPQPGVQGDGSVVSAVSWFEGTLEQALEQARSEGKLVFVEIGAYWCPPCHRLDEEVFTQPVVGAFLGEGYVPLHIDAEKGEGPDIAKRYDVQAFPTMLVLESSGLEKGRIVDFAPPEQLVATLKEIADGRSALAQLQAQVEADGDDLAERYRLGHALALAAKRTEAEAQFEVVLVGDPKDELGLASKVAFDRALFFHYKLDGDLPGAVQAFKALQRRYPDTPSALRAHREIGRILCELERPAEAVASLDAMLAEDPEDPELAASYGWFSFRERCEPQAGMRVVEQALERTPDNAELHYLAAELAHLLGDDERALQSMRQAKELEPGSAYYKRQVHRFEQRMGT